MNPILRRILLNRTFWFMFILLAMTACLAVGLSAGIRGGLIRLLTSYAVVGSLAGFGLSRSRLKGWSGSCLLIIGGLAGIIFDFAHLSEPFVSFIRALIILRLQIIAWIKDRINPPDLPLTIYKPIIPDFTPLVQPLVEVVQHSVAILARTWVWLEGLRLGTVAVDPVARAFIWALAVFLCSAWAGWFLGRHRNPMVAFAPLLILLAIISDYTGRGFLSLWLMLGGLLLLMGFAHYDKDLIRWQRSGVDFSESIPIDMGAAIVVITVVLAAIAWIVPSISVKALVDSVKDWGNKNQDKLAESFGLEPATPPPSKFSPYITPKELPRSHLVGSGPELNNLVVMTIRTGELPPRLRESNPPPAPHHYWRSLTYDRYTGSGWVSNPVVEIPYAANASLHDVNPKNYRPIRQEVKLFENTGGQVFWAGNLMSVDQASEVAWRVRPGTQTQYDPFGGSDLLGVISPVTSYVANSLEANMTVDELRSSAGPYPDWASHYMTLPDSVPDRVLSLARDLTANAVTPYDRAAAIESFLRSNYPYTLDVPAPPVGRDVADYFLFDLKKGYCDYYATAMVVLARAAGLPARFVIGYSSGTYDPTTAEYTVTEANAHSWPEIFFSDIGWVEFEPTAGLPAIERVGQPLYPVLPQAPIVVKPGTFASGVDTIINYLYKAIASGVIVLVALIFISLWVETLWLAMQPNSTSIIKIYRRLERQGNHVAGHLAGETPYEFSTRLIHRLNELFRGKQPASIRPAFGEIGIITETYVLSSFSQKEVNRKSTLKAIHTWRRLRLRLWLAELKSKFQKK